MGAAFFILNTGETILVPGFDDSFGCWSGFLMAWSLSASPGGWQVKPGDMVARLLSRAAELLEVTGADLGLGGVSVAVSSNTQLPQAGLLTFWVSQSFFCRSAKRFTCYFQVLWASENKPNGPGLFESWPVPAPSRHSNAQVACLRGWTTSFPPSPGLNPRPPTKPPNLLEPSLNPSPQISPRLSGQRSSFSAGEQRVRFLGAEEM